MPLVADVDDVEAVSGHPPDLVMDLCHQGTDGVDHDRCPGFGGADHQRRRTVSREHHRGSRRDAFDVVDEDHSCALEGGYNRPVVHDLVIAIHGRLEDPYHPGQGLDRHLNTCAEPARLGE